jgi:inorganic pyrophosphatase
LRVRDEHGPDPKVICVLAERAERDHVRELGDLPRRTLDELEHFFAVYKDLDTGRWAATDGYGSRDEALGEITAGSRRAAEAGSAGTS